MASKRSRAGVLLPLLVFGCVWACSAEQTSPLPTDVGIPPPVSADVGPPDLGHVDAGLPQDSGVARDASAPLPTCTRVAVWPEDEIGFGHAVAGSSGSARTLRVENLEDEDCRLAVSFGGEDAQAFRPLGGSALAANDVGWLGLQFRPQRVGIHRAEVRIADVTRTLTATAGTSASLLVVPPELDFGRVPIDCSARDRVVSVYNTASTAAGFVRAALTQTSTAFGFNGPSVTQIAPGEQADFWVSYRPTAFERYAGALQLDFDKDGEVQRSYVDMRGQGELGRQVDEFVQLSRPSVDLVVVVDDSPSMANKRTDLVTGFRRLYGLLTEDPRALSIGVTTADVSAVGAAGRLFPLDRPGERIVRGAPEEAETFVRNVDVGASGSSIEAPFEAAYRALTPPLVSGHNAGILGRDRLLVLLFASDADDQSPQAVDFYINFYLSIKGFRGGRSLVRAAALTAPQDGLTACPASTVSTDIEAASQQPRLRSLVERMGGVAVSMCDPTWPQQLRAYFETFFGLKSVFFLTEAVRDEEVEVYIDDVRTSSVVDGRTRWQYEFARNAVVFVPELAPEPGSAIRVEYVAVCR